MSLIKLGSQNRIIARTHIFGGDASWRNRHISWRGTTSIIRESNALIVAAQDDYALAIIGMCNRPAGYVGTQHAPPNSLPIILAVGVYC